MAKKYDTGSQYWVPPGFAAFKNEKSIFFGILLNIILVFLIDSFVLHPLAPPEGTFALQLQGDNPIYTTAVFGSEYKDATILSNKVVEMEKEVILLELNEEVHLLVYDYSAPLLRLRLQNDIRVEKAYSGTIRVGSGLFYTDVEVANGTDIEKVTLSSFSFTENNYTYFLYVVLGIVLGVLESLVYRKLFRK